MIILDTNIISALMQSNPDRKIVRWLDGLPVKSVWITSITVFEVMYGLNSLPAGKRKKLLIENFQQILNSDLQSRIHEFNEYSAHEAASIAAHLKAVGRPVEIRDVQIAGITRVQRATLATRNEKHFQETGISLINPWN